MKNHIKRIITLSPTEKISVFFMRKEKSLLMRFFNLFLFLFDKKFLTGTWTTIFNTIYVPGEDKFDDKFIKRHQSTLIHECTHIKQMKKYHIFFIITYLLPPALSFGRYYWEREAYYNQLKSYKDRLTQEQLILQINSIAKVLSSSTYLWSWPEKSIKKWFFKKFNLPL